MELILEQGLPHQERAVEAVCRVLEDVDIRTPRVSFENPAIDLSDSRLISNIHDLEADIRPEDRRNHPIGSSLTLDVKMETGTGKTYVYTKVMYELHRRYGFNKFIIVVPSLAIKAGTASFLTDSYARRHFSEDCGYDTDMDVGILSSQKKKKGKAYFPSVVRDFAEGSFQNRRKIYTLVTNMHLLSDSKSKMMGRDDYGASVNGAWCPLDALAATRPIVIIDEAHRFNRSQKAWKVITERLRPQCILRFGATFPETSHGRGKKKVVEKDYENLIYDLDACDSFNEGLIKGVAKEHFEPLSRREEKLKITAIDNREAVHFRYTKEKETPKSFVLKKGDPLSIISPDLTGLSISTIGRSSVTFSNGVEKETGMEMEVSAMMPSYQDQMMRLALQRHFETERANFTGRKNKIKTLALFFIDDISSYREGDDGKTPYLRNSFEKLLKEEMQRVRAGLSPEEKEYRDYLDASLADLSACHAGYFAQDNSDTDEAIGEEVNEILHGKKELLSFHHADGSWNTRRFLFSKWTLKEGWDNPNVFTICKLRSSGSEISKLQEVGRGLRLPVDEFGTRISNEPFFLNYIVDFTEADFAQKLVDEINRDVPEARILTRAFFEKTAEQLKRDPNELMIELLSKKYLDFDLTINPANRDAFFHEYPAFNTGVKEGLVRDLNAKKPEVVHIRKDVYAGLADFWEKVNRNYLLFYNRDLDEALPRVLDKILETKDIFRGVVMTSERTKVAGSHSGGPVKAIGEAGVQYTVDRPMPYRDFLLRIARVTDIPLPVLHGAIHRYVEKEGGKLSAHLINQVSAGRFIDAWNSWKAEHLMGHFRYAPSRSVSKKTALTHEDGTVLDTITQGRIGTKWEAGTPSEKYLYDALAYDSPLELQNIKAGDIEEVVVYGKIPRRSIAIPTIAGGTYSPDFMYIVKRKNGDKELHLIVETKDKTAEALSGDEKLKISCARLFFDTLSREGYKVYFHTQLRAEKMKTIVDGLLGTKE